MKRMQLKKRPERLKKQPDTPQETKLVDISSLVINCGGLKKPTKSALVLIEYLSSKGMSEGAIAGCVGVSVPTWINWKDRHPELMEALRVGKARGVNLASEVLFRRLSAGDLTAAIFYLKSQDGWKDAPASNETQVPPAKSTLASTLSKLTDDELQSIVELLARGVSRTTVEGSVAAGSRVMSPTPA